MRLNIAYLTFCQINNIYSFLLAICHKIRYKKFVRSKVFVMMLSTMNILETMLS